jgi:hypothetical protein
VGYVSTPKEKRIIYKLKKKKKLNLSGDPGLFPARKKSNSRNSKTMGKEKKK